MPNAVAPITCRIARHQQQEGVCHQLVLCDVAGLELQRRDAVHGNTC